MGDAKTVSRIGKSLFRWGKKRREGQINLSRGGDRGFCKKKN